MPNVLPSKKATDLEDEEEDDVLLYMEILVKDDQYGTSLLTHLVGK